MLERNVRWTSRIHSKAEATLENGFIEFKRQENLDIEKMLHPIERYIKMKSPVPDVLQGFGIKNLRSLHARISN